MKNLIANKRVSWPTRIAEQLLISSCILIAVALTTNCGAASVNPSAATSSPAANTSSNPSGQGATPSGQGAAAQTPSTQILPTPAVSNTNAQGPSTQLPAPAATAKVFSNLEEAPAPWWSCTAPCAGGQVSNNYSTNLVSSPVLDGQSREFFNGGGPYSNVLWVKNDMGAQNYAQHFLWDYSFYLDDRTSESVYAMEADLWLSQDHFEYMLGTQVHYPDGDGKPGHLDTWSQTTLQWIHNYDKPVSRFGPNQWHRAQWYMERNAADHSYTYKTLVIDGGTDHEQVFQFNQTYQAGPCDWADAFGIQWQLDLNQYGIDARENVDRVSVTLW